MADSNDLHAICNETEIFYLKPTSKFIIQIIESINSIFGQAVCAYSFDAGPNAFLFTTLSHLEFVLHTMNYIFGLSTDKPNTEKENLNKYIEQARKNAEDNKFEIKELVNFKIGSGIKVINK